MLKFIIKKVRPLKRVIFFLSIQSILISIQRLMTWCLIDYGEFHQFGGDHILSKIISFSASIDVNLM